ncbi:RHS repeat-associated core domain-containing protein [Pseudomonas fluorescens]|uniref:RHS repeat-associated core domain-containing protein n=1 Tax=Pseudomonas fluorescens TaxID=294 RepID=UPI003806E1F6
MNRNIHWRTPQLTVTDGRGLTVRQVDYLRADDSQPQQTLISRQRHDAAGRLIEQWDPRLFDTAASAGQSTVYGLSGMALKVDSVDAGWRISLPGLANELRQRHDQRGNRWRYDYDPMLRLIAVAENAQADVERYTYADHNAAPEHNLRGELSERSDPGATVLIDSYSLGRQALSEACTLAGEPTAFITRMAFDAHGNVLQLTDAGGHRQCSRYDVAGQLHQASLWIAGANAARTVLDAATYNASGQPLEQLAGNGVRSRRVYDPVDGRLLHLLAGKDQEKPLQDLHYTYDPVGNILRIEDHTLGKVYFANQRVDGNRHFVYDSLYRLIESRGFEGQIPQQSPGLPQLIEPIDPGRRFNYTEHYHYDAGNNLVELVHVREGHNFCQQMKIDPNSNRGLRWKTTDPDPVFSDHFDHHGNQLKLQPGALPLEWNSYDQLARATLLQHANGLPDDEEFYRYSQGERVYKCALSHTPSITHRREVRYLPGLEIHTRSDGQQLHVIALPGARCLHWLSGRPAAIEDDQMRYSLDDHLGSCALELDRHAGVISLEHYYAFGGTAWWAARSALEASYKTLRYSGREMDGSGLYYYGARYYAPWLQRWISADPAGDIDGLNLYAFVANNPVGYIDTDGQGLDDFLAIETPDQRDQRKAQSAERRQRTRGKENLSRLVIRHQNILALSSRRARDAQQQVLNQRSTGQFAGSVARRTGVYVAGHLVAYGGGILVGIGSQALGAIAPGAGNVVGVAMGIGAKKVISGLWDYAAERTGVGASIKFKASRISRAKIVEKAEYKTMAPIDYMQQKYAKMIPDTQKGVLKGSKEVASTLIGAGAKKMVPEAASEISATASAALGAIEIANEIIGASHDLTAEKVARGIAHVSGLIDYLSANMLAIENAFEATGVSAINTVGLIGTNEGDTPQSLWQATAAVINELDYTRTMLRSKSHQFSTV